MRKSEIWRKRERAKVRFIYHYHDYYRLSYFSNNNPTNIVAIASLLCSQMEENYVFRAII